MDQIIDEQKAIRAFQVISKAINRIFDELDWLSRCTEIMSTEIQEIRQNQKNLFQISLN